MPREERHGELPNQDTPAAPAARAFNFGAPKRAALNLIKDEELIEIIDTRQTQRRRFLDVWAKSDSHTSHGA